MNKHKSSPPKLFLRFFRWYCHPKIRDYIEGDLMEVYEAQRSKSGKRKVDLKFMVDVLLTLEFIGIWEELYNPDFKGNEFVTITCGCKP
jgi:hypothetical protein